MTQAPTGFRTCRVCAEAKPKERFQPEGRQCRDCRNAKQRAYWNALPLEVRRERQKKLDYQKRYAERHPERLILRRRVAHYKRKFGISLEQYNEMLNAQNGVCAICRNTCDAGLNLAVDHCHDCGQVRALLCKNCNTALGLLKENTDIMQAAIQYVRNHSEQLKSEAV